ncbi:MAG TPA: hypothetical protein VHY37_10325 [Tepidisphaeraceae bacterium]|jgi:hypothetical protein|nr:hypothetical protein [Tepidisphaeraceae bacterium]
MSLAIKQTVTVQPGGVVEVRSPELYEGDRAEVTGVVDRSAAATIGSSSGSWRRYAGAVRSDRENAGDSEQIDADLASEYGSQK